MEYLCMKYHSKAVSIEGVPWAVTCCVIPKLVWVGFIWVCLFIASPYTYSL